ncbi:MAG TPA: hypothetical protein ENN65_08370 [Candidatus Hydrogenedentes bacterium]|nr:hypothetical protein [Candidatus Hydrogenedentota bacterium]
MNKNIMHSKAMALVATAVAGAFVLAGCGAEVLMTTAVRGELEAKQAKSAVKQLDYVKGKVGDITIEQAIQAYRADNGVNPPSLQALVPKYLPKVPKKADGSDYNYNPATGKLTDGPVSAAPASSDTQMMERIRMAINQYGTATGYYPATLDDLYPNYLSQPPRTASGQPFIYNNQNGYVAHPAQHAAAAAPRAPQPTQRAGGGMGVGPMGEVMTGIGVQQQLGRMSTGGASSAQTRSRGDVNQISGGHTSRQNQVMDNLGL